MSGTAPKETPRYGIVETYYPQFLDMLEAAAAAHHGVVDEVGKAYDPGEVLLGDCRAKIRLEHGFLRVKCDACSHEHMVAFNCKRSGFCPSCGARRMIEAAAHLVDHVLPEQPIRHVGVPPAVAC